MFILRQAQYDILTSFCLLSIKLTIQHKKNRTILFFIINKDTYGTHSQSELVEDFCQLLGFPNSV